VKRRPWWRDSANDAREILFWDDRSVQELEAATRALIAAGLSRAEAGERAFERVRRERQPRRRAGM